MKLFTNRIYINKYRISFGDSSRTNIELINAISKLDPKPIVISIKDLVAYVFLQFPLGTLKPEAKARAAQMVAQCASDGLCCQRYEGNIRE